MPEAPGSAVRYAGTVYRAHNPEWAWSPLSGEDARRHGGRFNRLGGPRSTPRIRGAGDGDHNLVFWQWGDDLPGRLRVIDDDRRLPNSRESWR
jgi:RES domain-containing protein